MKIKKKKRKKPVCWLKPRTAGHQRQRDLKATRKKKSIYKELRIDSSVVQSQKTVNLPSARKNNDYLKLFSSKTIPHEWGVFFFFRQI